MKITIAPQAEDQLSQLPKHIQKKANKQFTFLLSNYRHPSLRTRKMGGEEIYEARIDLHNRFTFQEVAKLFSRFKFRLTIPS